MLVEGEVIAEKYQLERHLGDGGFASVWAARNVIIDRPVALKILDEKHARNRNQVDRFIREGTIASRKLHPTIVHVEDVGQTERGVPFLVMELLEGLTLDQVLRVHGALPLSQCLAIVRPLLEGLAAAHAEGVVHRDIKPANIFLVHPEAPGPAVRILDLGLAKGVDDDQQLTHTGVVLGTPIYMPPEVLLGRGKEDWRPSADVYSVGMMLFRMLTARLPFDAPGGSVKDRLISMISLYMQLTSKEEALPGPASFQPDISLSIDALVRRSLAFDPSERFTDAGAMLAALDEAPPDQPVSWEKPRTEDGEADRPRDSAISFEEPNIEDLKATIPLSRRARPMAPSNPDDTQPELVLPSLWSSSSKSHAEMRPDSQDVPDREAPLGRYPQGIAEGTFGTSTAAVTLEARSDSWRVRERWLALFAIVAVLIVAGGGMLWLTGVSGWSRTEEDKPSRTTSEGVLSDRGRSPVASGAEGLPILASQESDSGPAKAVAAPDDPPIPTGEESDDQPAGRRRVVVTLKGLPEGARATYRGRRIERSKVLGHFGDSGVLSIRARGCRTYRKHLTLRASYRHDLGPWFGKNCSGAGGIKTTYEDTPRTKARLDSGENR